MNIYSFADAMTTVAEAVMFWMLFEAFFERKKEWPIWIYGVCIFIVGGLIGLCNKYLAFSMLNNICMIFCAAIVYSFLYEGNILKKIGVVCLGLILGAIIEVLVLFLLTNLLDITVEEVVYSKSYRLFGIVISKTASLTIFNIIRVKGINYNYNVDTGYWGIFVLLFLNAYIAVFLFFRLSLELGESRYDTLVMLGSLGMFIGGFVILYLYEHQIQQERDLQIQAQKEVYLNLQLNHLNDMLAQQELLKRFKHDFSNQIIALEHSLICSESEKSMAHVRGLQQMYSHIDKNIFTGNSALDAILNTKKLIADNKGIRFKCRLEIPEELKLDPIDISVILGNALDNAIEACERIENEDKYIDVMLKYCSQGLFCKIVNSTVLMKAINNGRTSKKDSINHGYGLENINDVLKKYDSKLIIERSENKFSLKFTIMVI